MMTKKHFIAIAGTLANFRKDIEHGDMSEARLAMRAAHRKMADDFADMCAGENPNFDRAKFLVACRVAE